MLSLLPLVGGLDMINLPAGFDVSLLVSDIMTVVLPFASIAALFAAYRLVRRSGSAL